MSKWYFYNQAKNTRHPSTYLMMALTANLTTVESRKRGVTRMWKRDSEANASAGLRLFPLAYAWVTNVCAKKGFQRKLEQVSQILMLNFTNQTAASMPAGPLQL